MSPIYSVASKSESDRDEQVMHAHAGLVTYFLSLSFVVGLGFTSRYDGLLLLFPTSHIFYSLMSWCVTGITADLIPEFSSAKFKVCLSHLNVGKSLR